MAAIHAREEEKRRKYTAACGELDAEFLPVVFSPHGALGGASRRGLARLVGAECPEGCECNGRRHGLPSQRRELDWVLTTLALDIARGHHELVWRARLSVLAAARYERGVASRLRRQARRALAGFRRGVFRSLMGRRAPPARV